MNFFSIKCIIDDDGHFELTSNVLKLLRVIKVDVSLKPFCSLLKTIHYKVLKFVCSVRNAYGIFHPLYYTNWRKYLKFYYDCT